MVPSALMVGANKAADKAANQARKDAEGRPRTLTYCAGAPRFFYTWQGKMVVEHTGTFVRGRAQAAG